MKHLLFAIVAGLFMISTASAGEIVVVESTANSISVGSVFEDSDILVLKTNESVVLIDSSGGRYVIDGPIIFDSKTLLKTKTNKNNKNIIKALGALISSRETSTASLGVVRSASNAKPKNSNRINIETGGNKCSKQLFLILWRENLNKETVTIETSNQSKMVQFDWAKGDSIIPLAMKQFANEGKYYFIRNGKRTSITLHHIPSDLNSAYLIAGWMASKQCTEQATILLDSLL